MNKDMGYLPFVLLGMINQIFIGERNERNR